MCIKKKDFWVYLAKKYLIKIFQFKIPIKKIFLLLLMVFWNMSLIDYLYVLENRSIIYSIISFFIIIFFIESLLYIFNKSLILNKNNFKKLFSMIIIYFKKLKQKNIIIKFVIFWFLFTFLILLDEIIDTMRDFFYSRYIFILLFIIIINLLLNINNSIYKKWKYIYELKRKYIFSFYIKSLYLFFLLPYFFQPRSIDSIFTLNIEMYKFIFNFKEIMFLFSEDIMSSWPRVFLFWGGMVIFITIFRIIFLIFLIWFSLWYIRTIKNIFKEL